MLLMLENKNVFLIPLLKGTYSFNNDKPDSRRYHSKLYLINNVEDDVVFPASKVFNSDNFLLLYMQKNFSGATNNNKQFS